MKKMILRYPDQALLNEVADYILDEKPDFPERVQKFELVEGKSIEVGSGEQAIVEITIRYDELDQSVLSDIKMIIEYANKGASEVIVEIEDDK